MDVHQLIRDRDRVRSALTKTEDGVVMASRDVHIHIPERYLTKGLAEVSSNSSTLGIFGMIVDDRYYATSLAITSLPIRPTTITTIKIDGDVYVDFFFEAGSVVFPDTQVIINDQLLYSVFDEFFAKGHIPWFIEYQHDLSDIFDSAKQFAGYDFGRNHVILEIIAASVIRVKGNLNRYYRHAIQKQSDLSHQTPEIIPLRSISYGATNTISKLVGSYFGDGLTSALVNPSDRLEKIEETLRR